MCKRILLSIVIGLTVVTAVAQQSLSVNTVSVSNTSVGQFYYGKKDEPARAIVFKDKTVTASSFLANINQHFNIPAEFTFIQTESNTDHLGMQHRLLQQYYKGLPLEGLGYRVHEKDGFVTSANGRAARNIRLETQTSLSEAQAFQFAIKHLQTKDTTVRKAKKLIVSKGFTFTPESFHIAFQFDIDVSFIEQWRISIDARTGEVVNKVSLVNTCSTGDPPPLPYGTGTGLTNYYGSKTIRVEKFGGEYSRLTGQTENGGIIGTYNFANVSILSLTLFFEFHKVYEFSSANNTYNNPYHKPAVSVQWAAEQAYEYYFKKHNRNSFDNQGATIKSYVHVDENLNNAFWTHNLMAFGDGNNNNPLVELDVVSHELTHGVTQYEAGLQYFYESGALNESFSDIMGKAVEFYTFGDTATWQIAKHNREGGLRDFSNPNLKNQPDTYFGDMWYTGNDDNGGVHYNSGVQNFWFYLLCEGGSGINDHELSYSINPIGMEAAVNIAYRNLTEYLSATSDFLDSRIGSSLAAADLYGTNSTIYQEVDKAWDAVGVIDEPIITSLDLFDITATTVKIKGSLEPRGNTVNYHFEYGTTPALGMSTTAYPYTNTVTGMVTGLQSETKYYLRLVATNENGSSHATTEFTTISLAPLVRIMQTVDVTETTAVFYGKINPNSLLTSFYFEYGPTPALGLVTPTYPLSAGTEFLDVSASVTDLQPRQTYYYKLVATNGFASSDTESVSFFTAVKPVIQAYAPTTGPIGTEVTITGLNFNSDPEKNLVNFGATRATVLSSSVTEMKVQVPAGASLGTITVLDVESGLAAESVQEFVPTFAGEFNKSHLLLTMGSTDYIYQTLVQDMDGDHKPDIVARHYLGFSVFQNVNQGGDITEASFNRNIFNAEFTPGILSLVDFDGNGLKDVICRYQNQLRIYPNLSVPGYVFFGAPVDLPVTASLQDNIMYNDVDMDGHIDIVGCSALPGNHSLLVILRNQNPKGTLAAENFVQQYTIALPYYIYDLYGDDLNNDGKAELLAGAYNQNFVPILKNNSQPRMFDFDESNVQHSLVESYPQHYIQDLNQDGWKDVISHSLNETGTMSLLENKGTSPGIAMEIPVASLQEYTRKSIALPGDINGDGKVDLVVGIGSGKFVVLKNQMEVNARISNTSFEKLGEFGVTNAHVSNQSSMTINDLNGDGRPEIINTFSFNRFPHEGYQMEIWQNAPANCLDPSLITLDISNYSATIVLPPNTTFDQFEIEYNMVGNSYWTRAYSTSLSLGSGYSYQLRVRAKCYLGFTAYHYINFTTDCVDANSFSITNIGITSANLTAYNLGSFEIEYSTAGENQWITVPQNTSQITNLLPGTTYDVRFRGRWCNSVFKYRQFTTLCPKLSRMTITDVTYNQAVVNWTSNYNGDAVLEYSPDNLDWILIDETRTMTPLIPAKQYFVRGKLACTNAQSDFIYTTFVTPCPKVTTLSMESVTPFSAQVHWLDESQTGSYIITYSMKDGGPVTTVEANSSWFQLEDLTPGTTYNIAVAPQCTATKDFRSITFTTLCFVPVDLQVNDITYTTADLSWDDPFGGVPYVVDYAIADGKVWHTTETALTTVSLAELRPGTTYEVRVHINCLSVAEPYASLKFQTNLYAETSVGPNPTDSKITLSPSKNLIGNRFTIQDAAGRVMVDGPLLDYTFDLSYFSTGMYVLKIDGERPIKIVKR